MHRPAKPKQLPRRQISGSAPAFQRSAVVMVAAVLLLLQVGRAHAQPAINSASAAPSASATVPATLPVSSDRQPGRTDLFACGSEQALWLARIGPPPRQNPWSDSLPETLVRFYVRPREEGEWRELQPVDGLVASLTNRGSQLAVLLENGEWLMLDGSTAVAGNPVPVPRTRMTSLGSDADSVWAVAVIPGGVASLAAAYPTTKPARLDRKPPTLPSTTASADLAETMPASPPSATKPVIATTATLPSTAPAVDVISLIRSKADRWVGEADLPPAVASPADVVSLAIVESGDQRGAYVAVGRVGRVRVYRHVADGGWRPVGDAMSLAGVRSFRMFSAGNVPALWLGASVAGDADRVAVFNPLGVSSTTLECTRGSPPEMRTIAWATGRIRSIYWRERALWECVYDARTLMPTADPLEIRMAPIPDETLSVWRYGIVSVAMAIAIFAFIRQRNSIRAFDARSLQTARARLAPLQLRLLAGTIDAIPVLTAAFLLLRRPGMLPGITPLLDEHAEWVLGLATLFYIAHTLLGEVLSGRSIGKSICRLRVVGMDGNPPTTMQVVGRNLLRVIDVGLAFFPLMMAIFSPLRQRIGDVASGTIVVQDLSENPDTDLGG